MKGPQQNKLASEQKTSSVRFKVIDLAKNTVYRWLCAQEPKGRLEMVVEEVRVIDEKGRSA